MKISMYDAAVKTGLRMKDKQGLKVTTLTPEAEREWRAEIARFYPRVRGTVIPAPMYDLTVETLKARHSDGS